MFYIHNWSIQIVVHGPQVAQTQPQIGPICGHLEISGKMNLNPINTH